VDESTSWSKELAGELADQGVINHAGAAALRIIADRTGLTSALSRALARRGFVPVHDRGRVLADAAVLIADGGRVLADFAMLRDQAPLFGPVAWDPTLWRALDEIDQPQRRSIARARAKTREHGWSLIEKRHGRIPPSWVPDQGLSKTIVIRMDASLVIAHSDKELTAGTFQGTVGHHRLQAWCDNTGESLAVLLGKGSAGSNTTADHLEVLTEAIAQLPARYRRDLLITVDGAGASHGLVDHMTTLDTSPWQRVHSSIGWELSARERAAITRVPACAWEEVLNPQGQPHHPGEAGAGSLIRVGQIARASSSKAARTRRFTGSSVPSSSWPRRRFRTRACPALITGAQRSCLRPRIGRSRDFNRSWSDSIRLFPAASRGRLGAASAVAGRARCGPKEAKTRIVGLEVGGPGFDFLGFHHRLVRSRGILGRKGVTFLARWPSDKAMAHARDRLRDGTARSRLLRPVAAVVEDMNVFLRSWSGYFRYGHAAARFDTISNYALERLALFIGKRIKRGRRFGLSVLAYQRPDRCGLIRLSGIVVAPRANKPWRDRPNAGGERRR